MKKILSLTLAVLMILSMAACGGTGDNGGNGGSDKTPLADTMDVVLNNIVTENPVEFMGGTMSVDLTDTSEDGKWAVKYYTGLDSADGLKEAAFYEPMMGSLAFSMVAVRVEDAANAKSVAESMKNGIDTRKWICVEANEIMVAGYCDVVMLIMLDNQGGLSAQSFVDAFKTVCGADLDFTI